MDIQSLTSAMTRFFDSSTDEELKQAIAESYVPDSRCESSVLESYEQRALYERFEAPMHLSGSMNFTVGAEGVVFEPQNHREYCADGMNHELALAA